MKICSILDFIGPLNISLITVYRCTLRAFQENIEEMKQRIVEAEKTYEEVQPKLSMAIETTKLLKLCVESELSKKYKGRPVRIMGDINTL